MSVTYGGPLMEVEVRHATLAVPVFSNASTPKFRPLSFLRTSCFLISGRSPLRLRTTIVGRELPKELDPGKRQLSQQSRPKPASPLPDPICHRRYLSCCPKPF